MRQISEFLSKFKNLGLNERLSKKGILEAVNELIKPDALKDRDITIKNRIALIKGCGALKSEIVLRKIEILNKAKEKAGSCFVVDDFR